MRYFVIHSGSDMEKSVKPLIEFWAQNCTAAQFIILNGTQETWEADAVAKIRQAEKVIYIVGENSHASPNIEKEIGIALKERKFIYVVKLNGKYILNKSVESLLPEKVEAVPFVKISEPTVEMTFSVNNSPFAGKEGKFVTSRHLRDRLYRELLKDVSLKVEDTDSAEAFKVSGRGEMHLSILIETMRREGYEFQVSTPRVLYKTIDGKLYEPIERLIVDVPEDGTGTVFQSMGERKGELVHMSAVGSRMRLEFLIPARGLFGYKSEFLTATKGEGVMNSIFFEYQPYKGDIKRRDTGSLVAFETGEAVTYGLFNAQDRGILFVDPGTQVYEGMVVGVSPKAEDINVNVCKKKHMTNTRAAGSDDAMRLNSPKKMSLEECLEFLNDDELLEVTPVSLRIRKSILDSELRAKARAKEKKAQ